MYIHHFRRPVYDRIKQRITARNGIGQTWTARSVCWMLDLSWRGGGLNPETDLGKWGGDSRGYISKVRADGM